MKTKEELKTIKEEIETVNKKLCELTEDELAQVTAGASFSVLPIIFASGASTALLAEYLKKTPTD